MFENDRTMSGLLQRGLREQYHVVSSALDGRTSLELARSYEFDVIVLDWMFLGIAGLEVMHRLRTTGNVLTDPRQAGRMSSLLKARPACWFMLLSLLLLSTLPAWTQDKKPKAQLRTVHGRVIDRSNNPVPSAVVYLVNLTTQAVKTYIADESGNYRFSGLDPNADYELHAEHNDSISSTRTASTFNSSHDVEITLKLSHKRKS